jgi:erythronate-4-phosphate dehydrogenase
MIKVVADNKIPFLKGAFGKSGQVSIMPGSKITHDHLLDADALITRTRTKCNEALLKGYNSETDHFGHHRFRPY